MTRDPERRPLVRWAGVLLEVLPPQALGTPPHATYHRPVERRQRMGLRPLAWQAGGVLLLCLGAGFLLIVLYGLMLGAYGGVVTYGLLALPPLASGWAVLRRRPWARLVALPIALLYGAVVGFIATTPWRGVTPPPGTARPPLDLPTVLVAVAFFVAALLVAVGKPDRMRDVALH